MKVVKIGNKKYIYYAKCEECGSIISFMKSELGLFDNLACPTCKSTVYTNTSFYGDDPYLGDEELKKEVEEYLANKDGLHLRKVEE